MTPASFDRANTSSLLQKLDPEQRQTLDKAVIDMTPPTYTACYNQFKLADLGISFDAFYRYARRLRSRFRLHQLVELTGPGSEDAEKLLPRILCQELIEVLMVDGASVDTIHRLAEAYRITAQVILSRQRLDLLQSRSTAAKTQLDAKRAALLADALTLREKLLREQQAESQTDPACDPARPLDPNEQSASEEPR